MKRKWLAVGIILLFVGTCIIPAIAQNTEKQSSASRGNWLYVGGSGPGNYSKIQDAINASSDGDTVFVFSGTYRQGEITINKRIDLIGENRNTTIYDGDYINAFIITKNNVNISGFNFFNPQDAICIYSNNNTIMDNIFYSCIRGIHLIGGSSYNKINGNIFNCIDWAAILAEWGSYNEISHNFIYNCATHGGLLLINNHFTLISNNYFGNNSAAITYWDGGNQITICNNIFYKNEHALSIAGGKNFIKNNNFIRNKIDASFKSWKGSLWDSIFGGKIKLSDNYWNRPRLLPKLILGVNANYDDWSGYYEYLSFNIDWFPAFQPNDIVV